MTTAFSDFMSLVAGDQLVEDDTPSQAVLETDYDLRGLLSALDCFETQTTGFRMPGWIAPMQLESNLNSALDALSVAESLSAEVQNTRFMRVQNNFIDGMLWTPEQETARNKHVELSSAIDLDGRLRNLVLRLKQKTSEAIEFSKAAKLGALLIFGIQAQSLVSPPSFDGLSALRESLRKLHYKYRDLMKSKNETVIPVNLKLQRYDIGDDDYIVHTWGGSGESDRGWNTGLTDTDLEFNLARVSKFNSFKNQRIRRIGVLVSDRKSGLVHGGDAVEKRPYPEFWTVRLHDNDGGIPLGSQSSSGSNSRLINIKTVEFGDVAGTRNPRAISWSLGDGYINVNPNRRWRLEIEGESSRKEPLRQIREITLFFHIAYQTS